jgi:hypothetical protein
VLVLVGDRMMLPVLVGKGGGAHRRRSGGGPGGGCAHMPVGIPHGHVVGVGNPEAVPSLAR